MSNPWNLADRVSRETLVPLVFRKEVLIWAYSLRSKFAPLNLETPIKLLILKGEV